MATLTDRILVVIDAKSEGAVKQMQALGTGTENAQQQVRTLGINSERAGRLIKTGLVAGAAAFVGTGLVRFLQDSVQGFIESQEAARQFARATNAAVDEAGRFTTVLGALDISFGDVLEIAVEFQAAVGDNTRALEALGVQIQYNDDGTVNWTTTLQEFIIVLSEMPSGADAATAAMDFLGTEGAKKLAPLIFSGENLRELFQEIEFVNAARQSQEFQSAMLRLNLATEEFRNTLVLQLVPALSDFIKLGSDLINFATEFDPLFYGLVGALGLGAIGWRRYGEGAKRAAEDTVLALSDVRTARRLMNDPLAVGEFAIDNDLDPADVDAYARSLVNADQKLKGFRAGLSTVVSAIGPVNLAMLAFVAAAAGISYISKQVEDSVSEAAQSFNEMKLASEGASGSLEEAARALERDNNVLENLFAAFKSEGGFWTWLRTGPGLLTDPFGAIKEQITLVADALREGGRDYEYYKERIAEVAEEQGAFAAAAVLSEAATKNLNDILAEGEYSNEELAAAIEEAGEAQEEQKRLTEESKGIMEAYAASTYEAVDATLALFDKQFAAEDAQRRLNDAIRDFNEGGFESADDKEAALDDIAEAALRSASATVEAQRQQDILNGVYNDSTYYSQLLIDNLQALYDSNVLPAAAQEELGGMISMLETAQGKAGEGVNVDVNATGTEETTGEIDDVAKDRTSEVEIDITNNRGAAWTLDMVANPDGAPRTAYIEIDITNNIGASWVLDQVARRRTAYVDVVTTGATQAAAVAAAAAGGSQQPVQQQAPVVNNAVTVDLDGFQLRSVVREEVRFNESGEGGLP